MKHTTIICVILKWRISREHVNVSTISLSSLWKEAYSKYNECDDDDDDDDDVDADDDADDGDDDDNGDDDDDDDNDDDDHDVTRNKLISIN